MIYHVCTHYTNLPIKIPSIQPAVRRSFQALALIAAVGGVRAWLKVIRLLDRHPLHKRQLRRHASRVAGQPSKRQRAHAESRNHQDPMVDNPSSVGIYIYVYIYGIYIIIYMYIYVLYSCIDMLCVYRCFMVY